MRNSLKHGFRIGREYLTHWIAAGVILAAPGAAPEHWLADAFHELHVSPELLHLWAAEIDLRVVLSGLGVALIAGDLIWRRVRAQDGVNALAALEEDPTVDMVVSDINMPRTDGLTLLGRPREREDNLATIIVSAYGDMANIRTAMNRAVRLHYQADRFRQSRNDHRQDTALSGDHARLSAAPAGGRASAGASGTVFFSQSGGTGGAEQRHKLATRDVD